MHAAERQSQQTQAARNLCDRVLKLAGGLIPSNTMVFHAAHEAKQVPGNSFALIATFQASHIHTSPAEHGAQLQQRQLHRNMGACDPAKGLPSTPRCTAPHKKMFHLADCIRFSTATETGVFQPPHPTASACTRTARPRTPHSSASPSAAVLKGRPMLLQHPPHERSSMHPRLDSALNKRMLQPSHPLHRRACKQHKRPHRSHLDTLQDDLSCSCRPCGRSSMHPKLHSTKQADAPAITPTASPCVQTPRTSTLQSSEHPPG
jgi:hypothetical protein